MSAIRAITGPCVMVGNGPTCEEFTSDVLRSCPPCKLAAKIGQLVGAKCTHGETSELMGDTYCNTVEWCELCGAQRITATDDDGDTDWELPKRVTT